MVCRSDPKIVKGADEHLKFGRLVWGKDPVAIVNNQECGVGGSSIKGMAVDRDSWKEKEKN